MSSDAINVHHEQRATPAGRFLDGRIKSLILDLTVPRAGERLLDIGCGTGDHLALFRKKGCDVTGLDASPFLLDLAGQRLGHRAELRQGRAEDLPFSDNEFDIVTLITSLEFTEDPARAIAEAIRVCRGRIFIGAMNRLSPIGAQGLLMTLFNPPISTSARFFHLFGLAAMIRRHLQGIRLHWGSVIFLPWGFYHFATGLEGLIPVMNNPFGAFLGVSFPVTFSFQAIQEPLRESVTLNAEGPRPVTEIVREFKHGS
jgi:SAM-dependent methyltransferase